MHSPRENDENQAYNFISDFIPAVQYSTTAFPTVVLLKLLQNTPSGLRWATIVVVMQITVVKAKNKLQQYFACYQLAHYLVAHY